MAIDNERIGAILDLIVRIGEGDLASRGAVSGAQDELDAIVAGLNMLAEELDDERGARLAAEALLRDEINAYEHAPGLFCSIDPSTLDVLKCNATLASALGRNKLGIVGRSVLALHAADCRERARHTLEAVVRGEPVPHADFELVRVDGAPLLVELAASVTHDTEGRPDRLRLIWRDVTSHKELERQLLQAQRLQELGQLAGGIAHDFNNLLSVILSTADLAKHGIPTGTQLHDDLTDIESAAMRGADLTRSLLAFSRQGLARPSATTLVAGVRSALKLFARLIDPTITIDTRLGADPWCVLIDPAQLDQVVLNLAVNARDAMPRGGVITVETSNVELDEDRAGHLNLPAGPYALLTVADAGIGMTAEQVAQAFQPFYTTKAQGKGTGLGLSICYGIVHQAGGTIQIHSAPRSGTRVSVYLPRTSEQLLATERKPPRAARNAGELVLVAEDDSRVRRLIVRILNNGGYRVLEAADGRAALDLAMTHNSAIDLLLTDLQMPEIGGRELARTLRERGKVRRVLFVSGWGDGGTLHEDVGEDAELLRKPVSAGVLLESVRSLLARSRK